MRLIIDHGNTNIKLYFCKSNKFTKKIIFPKDEINFEILENLEFDAVIYCSVDGYSERLLEAICAKKGILFFEGNTAVPIKNMYKSKTLGKDRLAAAVGSVYLFPGQDVLSIDIGTAITYDFTDAEGVYRGGNISPGPRLRAHALHDYSAALPYIEPTGTDIFFADNTEEALLTGVYRGILFEIEKYIEEFLVLYPSGKVVLTGGDANLFVKKIKKTIFAEPNLVAIGLREILKYNLGKEQNL